MWSSRVDKPRLRPTSAHANSEKTPEPRGRNVVEPGPGLGLVMRALIRCSRKTNRASRYSHAQDTPQPGQFEVSDLQASGHADARITGPRCCLGLEAYRLVGLAVALVPRAPGDGTVPACFATPARGREGAPPSSASDTSIA